MAGELTAESIEASLGQAFGDEAPAPVSKRPVEDEPVEAVAEAPEDEPAAVEPDEDEPAAEAAPAPEPEFEIEVNGQREVIKGADAIKTLLQQGKDYSQKTEHIARERESIAVQAKMQQQAAQFQQVIMDDIAQLRAIDAQMEQFNRIDWSAAIDADFTQAMKWQEQRNQLRAARDAKVGEINWKKGQFDTGQAEAAEQMRTSEMQALVAKLPEFRDSTKAAKLTGDIVSVARQFGYTEAEVRNVFDHRALLILKELADYRALKANVKGRVNQVRDAPPVVKPGVVGDRASQARQANKDAHKAFVRAGKTGNHRAQEESLERIFARTFK